jgi:hypothetical protein
MDFASLEQVLALAGTLEDSQTADSSSARFRRFLQHNVTAVGQIRDYVEECLRSSGGQYNRALQDLINRVGELLGFSVTYGRYKGVHGQVGHDGLWSSPTGFSIVVEVKTSGAFSVNTAVLHNYINELVSQRVIPEEDRTMGLYIFCRDEQDSQQLQNSIVAEKKANLLRVVRAETLLSLAEIVKQYSLKHEHVLSLLRPSGPNADPIIDLMLQLLFEKQPATDNEVGEQVQERCPEKVARPAESPEVNFWLTPVASDSTVTAEQVIQRLVGEHAIYAFSLTTPGRRALKQGDQMAFYAQRKGVVAHATVKTAPTEMRHPAVRDPERYSWVFHLEKQVLYLNEPVVLDGSLRAASDAFAGRDPNGPWSWFLQSTRKISAHDFKLLTR